MERFVCIHGHYYQPPRENAWLEAIELQDSAFPFHDWNERITAESYAPNGSSRILDGEGRIVKIVNNYARTSFNFGPTLLAWMQSKAPNAYQAVLEADRLAQARFSGHGSAIAQAYNHMIMPLANSRDKYTQVYWGLRDFRWRFGRDPEGMWLPETAVDLETLECMATMGIRFTILEPGQASRFRPLSGGDWHEVNGAKVDPTKPYLLKLPSGKEITLFFYDGPVSRAVAFEGLLNKGEYLAGRLEGLFNDQRDWPQLVHIATDGETYGHHHRFGDMALAYALEVLENNPDVQITNYGEYLGRFPPADEVQVHENTSWSCAHGVERWRSNCGCNSGMHGGWHQEWRAPLREALDWLRDILAETFEAKSRRLLKDPWKARNEYIGVVLDRSAASVDAFLKEQAVRALTPAQQCQVLRLLEMQRHAMLMYTSCGWFFDELSGIETVQVISYAGRALQLAAELTGNAAIEEEFLERLEKAKGNIAQQPDGRAVYERFVRPASMDLQKAGAHYAVSSLFEDHPEQASIYCFSFRRERQERFGSGLASLVLGRVGVDSTITRESALLSYGALRFGDHSIIAGVRYDVPDEDFEVLLAEARAAFSEANFPEVMRIMDRHFGESAYSLRSLFRDKQREVIDLILTSTLAEAEADYRRLYDRNFNLMRFLTELNIPLPQGFRAAARFVLTSGLRQALRQQDFDAQRVRSLMEEANGINVTPDDSGIGFLFQQALERMMDGLTFNPNNLELLQKLEAAVVVAGSMPFDVNLREAQNGFYQALQVHFPRIQERALRGDDWARQWTSHFTSLGQHLGVRVG